MSQTYRPCGVAGCDSPASRRGYCSKHYQRWWKYGDANSTLQAPKSGGAEEKLVFYGWTVRESGCWEWRGGRVPYGYGRIKYGGGFVLTHRLSYETWIGPIPEGQVVRHKCDNPPCMNPDHLEVGTRQDNMDDMVSRGRSSSLSGGLNPSAKLTEQDVLDIRREYGYGVLTQQMLAEVYGVTQGTISKITLANRWSHY